MKISRTYTKAHHECAEPSEVKKNREERREGRNRRPLPMLSLRTRQYHSCLGCIIPRTSCPAGRDIDSRFRIFLHGNKSSDLPWCSSLLGSSFVPSSLGDEIQHARTVQINTLTQQSSVINWQNLGDCDNKTEQLEKCGILEVKSMSPFLEFGVARCCCPVRKCKVR